MPDKLKKTSRKVATPKTAPKMPQPKSRLEIIHDELVRANRQFQTLNSSIGAMGENLAPLTPTVSGAIKDVGEGSVAQLERQLQILNEHLDVLKSHTKHLKGIL